MGMFLRTRIEYVNVYGENPDPSKFEVKECLKIGKVWISIIRYPNCTNFEGKKILLTDFDPRNKSTLDPHFEQGSGILARFEPTADGWMDKNCAKML